MRRLEVDVRNLVWRVGLYAFSACWAVIVRMVQIHTDEVQLAVVDAALGADGLGKRLNGEGVAFQDDSFEAMIVVKMHMHGRDSEIMVFMLHCGQPGHELAFMVVEHVGQASNTVHRLLGADSRPIELGS